jgi:hypothetical protein
VEQKGHKITEILLETIAVLKRCSAALNHATKEKPNFEDISNKCCNSSEILG